MRLPGRDRHTSNSHMAHHRASMLLRGSAARWVGTPPRSAGMVDSECARRWSGHLRTGRPRRLVPPETRDDLHDGRSSGVARGGVEPPTFRFSVGRSYQLSYLARAGLVLLRVL